MKKFALMTILFLSVLSFASVDNPKAEKKTTTSSVECKYGQCSATKSDGKQCRNCCQKDSNVCWSHR